jgi:membrane protein
VLAWFLFSAFAVLLGAEVNAELERQTTVDTTVGGDKPAGRRGAAVADTVGDAASGQ